MEYAKSALYRQPRENLMFFKMAPPARSVGGAIGPKEMQAPFTTRSFLRQSATSSSTRKFGKPEHQLL